MGKGYEEGPAAEEAEAARERGDHLATSEQQETRRAVWGSTADNPTQHFIGWADEVDADQLFTSGAAWGVKVVSQ